MSAKKISQYGLLIALALVMSYVEAQFPAFFAVPGMKLGLTNIVVIYALYAMDFGAAAFISIVRIFLAGFMFGNGVSVLYSLAGGVLSLFVMYLLKKTKRFHMVTVSIAGGVMHNVGQILVAMALLQTSRIAWYLLVLWFSGIGAGVVVGIISYEIVYRLKRGTF